jgi:hypothetical protein
MQRDRVETAVYLFTINKIPNSTSAKISIIAPRTFTTATLRRLKTICSILYNASPKTPPKVLPIKSVTSLAPSAKTLTYYHESHFFAINFTNCFVV